DLVVGVGEVLDVLELVTAVQQVATEHIEGKEGAGVANMWVELWRHAAGVDAQYSVLVDGDKLILTAAQGRVHAHRRHARDSNFCSRAALGEQGYLRKRRRWLGR